MANHVARRARAGAWLAALIATAGCGDDGASATDAALIDAAGDAAAIDARVIDARPIDAMEIDGVPVDASLAGCDYVEPSLEMIDYATKLTLTDQLTICGQIAAGPPANGTIDVDRFSYDGSAGAVIARLWTPAGGQLGRLSIALAGGNGPGFLATATHAGDHAALVAVAPAGISTIVVSAQNLAALPVPMSYRLVLEHADAATLCPAGGQMMTYSEAADGAGNTGNDVYLQPQPASMAPAIVATAAADAPEATGLFVDVSGATIHGTAAANASAAADAYQDRDTYALQPLGVDELLVRVSWAGNAANLDALLVDPGAVTPRDVARSARTATAGDELLLSSVITGLNYHLWIGDADGSAQPTAYTVALCGVDAPPP